jgi:hypothetical protein
LSGQKEASPYSDFFPHPRVHGGHWKNLQMIPEGNCEKSFSTDFMFEELISFSKKNFILDYKGKAFSKNPMSPIQKVSVSVVFCILY